MKQCVLVLGMHRSGTSVLSGLLNQLGYDVGSELMQPTQDNPKGYFENHHVYQLNKRILKEQGVAWDSLGFECSLIDGSTLQGYVQDAVALIESEFRYVERIVLKDPRLCLLFPVWEQAFKQLSVDIKVIMAIRGPLEVARSLQKRNDFSIEKGMSLWGWHVLWGEKFSRAYPRMAVFYQEDYTDLQGLLGNLAEFLECTVSETVMQACIGLYSGDLGHYSKGFDNLSELPGSLQNLVNLLRERRFDQPELDQIRTHYTRSVAFFQKPLSQALASREYQYEDLSNQHKRHCRQYDDLRVSYDKRTQEYQQFKSLSERQERDYGQLEKGFKKQRSDHEQLIQEYKKQKNDYVSLEQGYKKKQSDYEQLEQGYKKKQSDYEQLEQGYKKKQSDYEQLEQGYKKKQSDYQQLETAYKLQQADNEHLHLEVKTLRAELSDLTAGQLGMRQAHDKQVQAFESKLQQLTREKKNLEQQTNKQRVKIREVEALYHKIFANRAEVAKDLRAHRKELSQYKNRFRNLESALQDVFKGQRKQAAWLNHQSLQSRYEKRWYWPVVRQPLATHRKKLIAQSGLFSPTFYLASYPDVWKSGMEPLEHFYKYGWREGRRPSEDFDLQAYLQAYPDVAAGNMNPLLHYLIHGKAEGRSPRPVIKPAAAQSGQKAKPSAAKSPAAKSLVVDKPALIVPRDWPQRIPVIQWLAEQGDLPLVATAAVSEKLQQYWQNLQLSAQKNVAAAESVHQPLVSIVMPTWNREAVIVQAVDSVLKQSYTHWELIIADDGSTDQTLPLIREQYAAELKQKRIILLENEHGGVCAARNAGLAAAQGDLIAYLDSDNQWVADYLSVMVLAFVECDELNAAYSALHAHDHNKKENFLRARAYNRRQLLESNFIDLNVFMHRAMLYRLHGGFDLSLKRLVDWELILRYTRHNEPAFIPFVGADYYLDDKRLNNITTAVAIEENREKVYRLHGAERLQYGLDSLRLAYVLWDFPALSQTFVMNELRWLIRKGFDVKVYHSIDPDRKVELDFEVDVYRVSSGDELVELLREHKRNYCHSHFAYPAVTKLTWPACQELGIPFSFMPHAVDIFHHDNQKRNRIDEISYDPLCRKIFVHGDYHRDFLLERGVNAEKLAYNFQAVNLTDFMMPESGAGQSEQVVAQQAEANSSAKKVWRGIFLSRFVEKKGFHVLLEAMDFLDPEQFEIRVYGYGPLEAEYRTALAEKGFTHLKLMGAVDDKARVRQLYDNSDFLIVPSVEAQNGDRDGFPTVILEAFSMGVPVVTTDIAAIPDYLDDGVHALLAPADDANALADKIQQLAAMPETARDLMRQRARQLLHERIGTEKSMQRLTDVWLDQRLDIFLVTYNTEKYNDEAETLEIIRRLYAYTTTPFVLTIVDNGSDEAFWQNVSQQLAGRSNVRLIRKQDNLLCGPGSNIALETGEAEFAIYMCSKEGFVARKGWERPLIEAMRANPKAALGGHRVHLPKYTLGREYKSYPDFNKFRNPDFMDGREEQVFTHIQGGVFIVRRAVVLEHGGFNPLTPHGGMDIELSYYYESLGYELLDIPEVVSLTVKTRPKVTAVIDEHVSVVHPLTCETVEKSLDNIVAGRVKSCNLCEWQGDAFLDGGVCPECGSGPDSRLVYRYLAASPLIYRGKSCLLLGEDDSLQNVLAPLFRVEVIRDAEGLKALLEDPSAVLPDCVICCTGRLPAGWQALAADEKALVQQLSRFSGPVEGVVLIAAERAVSGLTPLKNASVVMEDSRFLLQCL